MLVWKVTSILVRSINNPCPQAKSSLRVAFPMMQAGPSSGACLQLELHCCWRSLGDLLTQASVKMKKHQTKHQKPYKTTSSLWSAAFWRFFFENTYMSKRLAIWHTWKCVIALNCWLDCLPLITGGAELASKHQRRVYHGTRWPGWKTSRSKNIDSHKIDHPNPYFHSTWSRGPENHSPVNLQAKRHRSIEHGSPMYQKRIPFNFGETNCIVSSPQLKTDNQTLTLQLHRWKCIRGNSSFYL